MTAPGQGQPPDAGHWQYQDPYGPTPAGPTQSGPTPSGPPAPPSAPTAFPYVAAPPPWVQWGPPMAMQPVYGAYAMPTNGLATAAMVLGIISIPGAITFFFDLPIAIVGLILGIVGLRRANRMPQLMRVGKGKAIAGIACASIGLVLSASLSIYIVTEFQRCSQYAVDSPAWDRCFNNEPE